MAQLNRQKTGALLVIMGSVFSLILLPVIVQSQTDLGAVPVAFGVILVLAVLNWVIKKRI